MREHSTKSAESEYVRILWACTFMDNFTAKYTENLAHAHAVDTRPSLRIIEGLGTRLENSIYMYMCTCMLWSYAITCCVEFHLYLLFSLTLFSHNSWLMEWTDDIDACIDRIKYVHVHVCLLAVSESYQFFYVANIYFCRI